MEYFDVNQETKEPEIKKTKKFNANDEKGKNYEIEMELNTSFIEFKTEINDGIITKKYSNILSFNKLKENIIFAVQDTIEEIYEQLEIYINDNPVSCEMKENNIIIKLTTKVKKIPEIIFELKQEEIGQKQLINILIEKINILEEKNKDVESKNNNLESKVNSLESKITNLESTNNSLESKIKNLVSKNNSFESKITNLISRNNSLESKIINLETKNNNLESKISSVNRENFSLKKEIEKLKNSINVFDEYVKMQKEIEKEQYKFIFSDSLIIKELEKKMICDWIKPNANIKTKLLYRVSRDGDGPDIFHKYCDNQGPTIIFVKINNGYRFGGYTGISWDSKGGWIKDKDAFLFSLNNKLKFMNNNTECTVYHGPGFWPDFGDAVDNELVINYFDTKCLTGKPNYCNDSKSAFTFKNKDLVGVDVKGIYNFDVEDYEVYSIIY